MKHKHHISGKPNAMDDDTIDRGVTGQSLRDKSMSYDPATGKPFGEKNINLNHSGREQFEDMDDD